MQIDILYCESLILIRVRCKVLLRELHIYLVSQHTLLVVTCANWELCYKAQAMIGNSWDN
jgi:hypothetical protein